MRGIALGLEYLLGVRVRVSITLSAETVRTIDKAVGAGSNRSRLIEEAVCDFLVRRARAAREARDLAILNGAADELNREVRDVLAYQADI